MVHEGTRPWKRPSWRSMPLEERRVRSPLGDTPPREALGANWRSAQCVTSLYDAFVQLQQENEALREDARQVKQEVELQGNQGKLRQPEDTRCEQFEQEIRLLRSEMLRLEQTHRQQLTALETRASTSETTHRQLLAKYQERFALDPLEAKRSALAVKTMQNTLHNTLLEKEELAIRYGELKDLYRRFQHEQTQMVQTLQDKVQTFERQRKRIGQQRVVNALAVWSTNRMERAWQQWSAVTRQCRQQEQHKQLTSSLEHQADEKIAQIRRSQAAVLIGTLLQRAARRTFTRWKNLARKKAERRRKGVRFTEERNRRTLQRVVTRWKVEVLRAKDHQMAVTKLRRLLNGHKRRDGVRKWRVWVFRSVLTEKTREVEELRRVMIQQASKFEEMESALEATQMESKGTAILYQEEKARYDADIQSQRATELAIRQKLGHFFTKRSDRQLLRQLIGHWKQTAKHQRRMNERAALVASKLKIIKSQRAVRVWHSKTRLSRRSRLQTQQIISRMRQLGVLRCFNSWKESVEEVKKRKEGNNVHFRWQRQIVLKEQQFLLLQVQIDRDCHVKQLEVAFEEFRSTQKTLLEQAEHAKSRQEAEFQEVQAQLQQTAKREHRYAAAFKALCSSREKSVSLSRNFKDPRDSQTFDEVEAINCETKTTERRVQRDPIVLLSVLENAVLCGVEGREAARKGCASVFRRFRSEFRLVRLSRGLCAMVDGSQEEAIAATNPGENLANFSPCEDEAVLSTVDGTRQS
ncbi:hypothetical protein BBJ28_00003149 [Nothophytophthora sp. Chile5]|nr:hypothetical protein BBJ28_00003149 [Nothophytophthora sp. Chile5]